MTGGTLGVSPTAPDESIKVLSTGQTLSATFLTLRSRQADVVWHTDCPSASRLAVELDGSVKALLTSTSAAWKTATFPLAVNPGSHTLALIPLAGAGTTGCMTAAIDRIDLLPAQDNQRVILGAAVRASALTDVPGYADALLAHFSSVTPENELKMNFVEPTQGQFDFQAADQVIDFAARHRLAIRGHVLVWGQALPDWVTDPRVPWTPSSLLAVMQTYIETVMSRYRHQISTWDVVNEAFNANGSPTRNIWYDVIGPSYIEDAFRIAHRVDPKAILFYNDWGLEWPGRKLQAVVALISRLRAEGVDVDGVGLQDHVSLESYPTQRQIQSSLETLAALGIRVEITEMTVSTLGFQGSAAQAAALQAAVYHEHATACWDVAACERFTVWGVYDGLNYLGADAAPLLFNTHLRPKPALAAVETALHLG
jgi:endo-1,4-beta-xylanase